MTRRALTVFVLASGVGIAASVSTAWAQTTPPAPKPQTAPAPAPATVVLPTGAKIGFVNLQIVFSESELGKGGQARWRGFNDKLFAGLTAREKEIQGLSEKIKTQQTIIDETVIRMWNQDLARLQREMQFAQQEAQVQSEAMQQQVLADFSKKIQPVLDGLRAEKGLHAIVGVHSEPGGLTLLSAEPGLDLSAELIKRLNTLK